MLAMIQKEFRQLRRDRRTLVMLVALPLLLLVMFGYAASFEVDRIQTRVYGSAAEVVVDRLPDTFTVEEVDPAKGRADAEDVLSRGESDVVVIADPQRPQVLLDGSEIFTAQSAMRALAQLAQGDQQALPVQPEVDVLFNPDLDTSAVMVPAIIGLILLFVGTVITSLGVVRERQAGTLQQLAVMPLRAGDVIAGKIAPYLVIGIVDMALITAAGILLFGVPFNGSAAVFALGALIFLFTVLGIGVLISTVSENQGQAIQLSIMILLPQVLLSGMIFPLESMAAGVRWIAYVLPLSYFNQIARGVMLRGAPLGALWQPMLALLLLGVVTVSLALVRFRRDLAPGDRALEQVTA